MGKISNFFKHYHTAILAGVFIGTSYVPFPPWALLFCYTPLFVFWVSENRSLKEIVVSGWITQFILSIIGFNWIAYTAHEYGAMPWSVSIAALILFAAFIHIYFPLVGILHRFIYKFLGSSTKSLSSLVCLATLFAFVEHFWPSIFPWNMGYTLFWAKIPAYQFADIIGFEGLTFLILLSNALLAYFWIHRESYRQLLTRFAGILISWLALSGLGHLHKPEFSADKNISILTIQANIGNLEKAYAELGRGYQASIIDRHLSLMKSGYAAHPESKMILIPETAFPAYLDDHNWSHHTERLVEGLEKLNLPLMGGAFSKNEKGQIYNAFFLVGPNGKNLTPPYLKTHLLAFGEYLPFSEQFPILLKWMPFVSNFSRGSGPKTLNWNDLRIGPQICYESLSPQFSRELALQGAQFLVNVTNDSWFGDGFEPRQHSTMTLARSIETRLPLIRSTNTGITTAILPDGKNLEASPLFEEWIGSFAIAYNEKPTLSFFTKYGQFYAWILVLMTAISVLWGKYEKHRK